MRLALQRGTSRTIDLLAVALQRGVEDGSLRFEQAPESLARRLYALWLGTSVMGKITRTTAPFTEALLPGWDWSVGIGFDGPYANVSPKAQPFPVELDIWRDAPTPALALVLAALKAHAAKETP